MNQTNSNRRETVQLTFSTQVWKEGRTYIAYAPELDISSCGPNLTSAKKALVEAVDLFIEDAFERGVLDDVLFEAGFQRSGRNYRFRRVLGRGRVRLALPRAS